MSEGRKSVERREFVAEGLKSLFRPFRKLIEDRLERVRAAAEPLGSVGGAGSAPPPGTPAAAGRLLRPPGALKEELFLDRCQRSGECVPACPVQAIRPLLTEDGRLNGTPFIDPEVQACVVCEGLHCMKACPSGALSWVPRHLIAMGLAEVRQDVCVRSKGEDCRICVEKCPLGSSAIEISSGQVLVKPSGCVGCGVCEMYCPTDPRAIVVRN